MNCPEPASAHDHSLTTDLHCHSTFSDGLLSPAKLVDLAKVRGIATLSVTDHDTMNGMDEAIQAGQRQNIRVIPGIELSVCHHKTAIHLLGYGLDSKNNDLRELLDTIQKARVARNEKIIDKLNSLGYKISFDQLPEVKNGQLGRPHIASLLVQKKIVYSEDDAFRRFLRCGAAAYAPRDIVSALDAIRIITGAGGFAVLAHPGILGFSEIVLERLINELCDIGLHGIEVYHPVNSKKLCRFLAKLCKKNNLLPTGGSDFHGRNRDKSQLGEYGGGRKIPTGINALPDRCSQ